MRLSLYDYELSREIAARDEPIAALIAAAMRKADTDNMAALAEAFPHVAADLKARYNAPGGELPGDRPPRLVTGEGPLNTDIPAAREFVHKTISRRKP